MAIIETEGLTKYYKGGVRGVEGLELSVQEGELFGFLGPNGAGKTTTIRLLLNFIRPSRGHARVFGLDTQKDSIQIRARVGNLPGEFGLYQNMNGRQFLSFMASLRPNVEEGYIKELAQRLDLDLSRPIQGYSHGMRQKLGLIQALMHRPELLILDEPTTGLDPLMQQEAHRLLKVAKESGSTIFFSSHILPEVERIADRVGIIREGSLAAVESIADLRRKDFRRVEFTFAQPVKAEEFRLPGVLEVTQEDELLRLLVQENLDGVIKAAARYNVLDMDYHRASLEDIFMTYYRRGNDVG